PYAKHAETVNRLLTISNEECGTTNRGAIRYDEDNNNLVFCNGTNWVAVGSGNEVSFTTDEPEIIAPPAGKVTLAICVPEGTCNGAVLTGSPFGWDPASGTAAFTKVAGTETWYSVTFDYAAGAMLIAIATPNIGTTKWETQWENIEILEGDASITIQYNTEPRLDLGEAADGTVIYVTIENWKIEPCAPSIPGGEGTFTFTPACELSADAVVIFTGNFAENGWVADPTREMTRQENGSYTWTGTYPEGFQMKVIVDGVYMSGENVPFDGTTFSFTGTGDFCPVP
ncbi:MAG: hypothetical protein KA373_05920, partial [Paludibacteraceae bacterium]|nr:hypothetical protein [Paludibacteraceae bacterium]